MVGVLVKLEMLLDNFSPQYSYLFTTLTLVTINGNHSEGIISYFSSCSVDLGEHTMYESVKKQAKLL